MNNNTEITLKRLSKRQIETLDLLSKGYTNKEIAKYLGIKVNTVKIHVASILDKLQVVNRTEATTVYNQSQILLERSSPFIQVLPFKTNNENETFTDDLILSLSKWYCFSIIENNHDNNYKLNTFGYTISGEISYSTDVIHVRLTAYEYSTFKIVYKNKLSLQSSKKIKSNKEICTTISAQLIPELRKAERIRLQKKESDANSTWSKTIEGLYLITLRTKDAIDKALKLFTGVLSDNGNDVLAYYGIVECYYIMLSLQYFKISRDEILHKLHNAARNCYRIDNTSVYGLYSMGLHCIAISNPLEAVRYLEESIHTNPSLEKPYLLLSHSYLMLDRVEDGLKCIEKLGKINPISLKFGISMGAMSVLYFAAEKYEDAIKSSYSYLQVVDNEPIMLLILIASNTLLGNFQEVDKWMNIFTSRNPDFSYENLQFTLQPFKKKHTHNLLAGLRKANLFTNTNKVIKVVNYIKKGSC